MHFNIKCCNYSYLCRLHVEDLSDASLHDEKVRIVDVQLNRTEQVLNARVGRIASVDQVFVAASNNNLTTKQTRTK